MPPEIDLYGVLGVGRDADQGAIHRAYRARAKSTHPDAGGSPDEFRKVSTAHRVLTNAEQRAKYDATGSWDDAAPPSEDQRVLQLIGEALMGVVNGDGDPAAVDLVEHFCRVFQHKIEQMRKGVAGLGRAAARTKKLQNRFRRRDGQENRIDAILASQERSLRDAAARLKSEIADHERAVAFLKDYEFRKDAPVFPQQIGGLGLAAGLSGRPW